MSESSSPDEAAGMAPVVQLAGIDEDSVASENTQEVQIPIENAVEDKAALQIDDNDEDSDDEFHDAVQEKHGFAQEVCDTSSPELSTEQAAVEADTAACEEANVSDNDSDEQEVESDDGSVSNNSDSSSFDNDAGGDADPLENNADVNDEQSEEPGMTNAEENLSYVPPTLEFKAPVEVLTAVDSTVIDTNGETQVNDAGVKEEESDEAAEKSSYAPPILEPEASEKVDIDISPKSIASNDVIIEIHDKVGIEPDTDIDAAVSMNESNLASPRSFSTEDEETPSLSVQYIKSQADGSVTQIPCFVKPSTPIPNSDSSLRLLRKFISKTSKYFPVSCGGTKPSSILSFFFGGSSYKDECTTAYKNLVDILLSGIDDDEEDDIPESHADDEENDAVIESILGGSGDTMSKARSAIACFCSLIEIWCLETQRISIIQIGGDLEDFEDLINKSNFYSFSDIDSAYVGSKSSVVNSEVMAAALTCAEGLVAHGCFDGVMLGIGEEEKAMDISSDTISIGDEEEISAVSVLCGSIYNCFLENEAVELATLKFLLTTGCRTITSSADGDEAMEAMLKGAHLLQAIRVCYRLYLSTDSAPNKTTAKAALRQIVTSTFKRLESKKVKVDEKPGLEKGESIRIILAAEGEDPFSHAGYVDEDLRLKPTETDDMTMKSAAGNFPSYEHKDAYLVLRSLCKLSMKAVSTNPDVASYMSTPVVMSRNESSGADAEAANNRSSRDFPSQPILMDPALDSKILALDLILEILQRTETEIFMNAGPHLIYAVRNYLCHSLLKNCTINNTYVVNLSLQLFVPLIRHFRSHLKTEIEAFVTNVFFVILDSKNSTVEHKLRVVLLFEEICSDTATLAEIFLNYDCDLSAVDLFQRIVNTLARVAKIGLHSQGMESTGLFVGNAGATRAEKIRQDHRALRLEAMKAVRKILASLYASIVATSMGRKDVEAEDVQRLESSVRNVSDKAVKGAKFLIGNDPDAKLSTGDEAGGVERQSLVQIYDSKKKRKEDFAKVILKFNQKPKAGIKLAAEVGLLNEEDPADVAQFLLTHRDSLDKTQTGEFLGMEAEYKNGFMLKVLNHYAYGMDFTGLQFDDAIKMYLSGFRLPGEAQKVSHNIGGICFRCPCSARSDNIFCQLDRSYHGKVCGTLHHAKFRCLPYCRRCLYFSILRDYAQYRSS